MSTEAVKHSTFPVCSYPNPIEHIWEILDFPFPIKQPSHNISCGGHFGVFVDTVNRRISGVGFPVGN